MGFKDENIKSNYLDSNVEYFTNFYSLEFTKEFDISSNNKTIIQYLNQNDYNKTISIFFGLANKGESFSENEIVRCYFLIKS